MYTIVLDHNDYGTNPQRFTPFTRYHESNDRTTVAEVFDAIQSPGIPGIEWQTVDTVRLLYTGPGAYEIDRFKVNP